MTEKPQHPPVIDPDMVPGIFCDGMFNISITGELATLTFTHARPNATTLFLDGRVDPSYIVRARIVITVNSLVALRDLLNHVIQTPNATTPVTGGPTRH